MDKGDKIGIMAQLFTGNFDQELLFPFPSIDEEEAEMADMINNSFREFAKRYIDPVKLDEEHHQPEELIQGLFDLGIMSLTIPEEYEGAGMGMQAYCKVNEVVGATDAAICVTLGAHQSIGMKALLLFGTEEQKKKYMPDLACGKRIAAYALTEPGAGSDASSIATRAVYDPEKKSYTVNGSKLWITNGGIAGFITLFAKEEIEGSDTITAFILEGESPGLKRGKPEMKMGIRSSNTTELFLEDVVIPEENVLGIRGKGFKVALEVLDYGRLGLAAACVGGMKELLAMVLAHTSQRKQFDTRICDLEMVRSKLSEMAMLTWASESITYMAASLPDRGVRDFSIEGSICKAFVSEALWKAVDHGMQCVGGVSYMTEYPYERFMRDSRINLIFEGTNEIQRLYVALAGLKRPGKLLKAIQKRGKVASLVEYGAHYVKKRLTSDKLDGVHPSLESYKTQTEEGVKAFSIAVDKVLVRYGKKIMRKGFQQERIANAAIYLFGMCATLSRIDTLIKAKGADACAHEKNLTRLFFARANHNVKASLRMLEENSDRLVTAVTERLIEDEGYRVN